jgi:predicted transcriptional regulator
MTWKKKYLEREEIDKRFEEILKEFGHVPTSHELEKIEDGAEILRAIYEGQYDSKIAGPWSGYRKFLKLKGILDKNVEMEEIKRGTNFYLSCDYKSRDIAEMLEEKESTIKKIINSQTKEDLVVYSLKNLHFDLEEIAESMKISKEEVMRIQNKSIEEGILDEKCRRKPKVEKNYHSLESAIQDYLGSTK